MSHKPPIIPDNQTYKTGAMPYTGIMMSELTLGIVSRSVVSFA